jgi:hypothetical protein
MILPRADTCVDIRVGSLLRFLNRETGESKGTGKVEFQTAELAQKAIQARPLQRAVYHKCVDMCRQVVTSVYI